ncbi:toll/interleukin-1 receptor domain-containing protein [Clostridium aminobutyricum]|uniref:Toll/interleukin-1 receptor domain-containing protein n=1 Tax=Clostridium aminobutyricum TaxID=33953 RepID=A0A939DBD5_CLOAM|nr:toll/interleukin-1 receptor domain-containing protein [Clostridium aminobutyricum]MBN7774630.1 toll/interleukin-1 receptor domain-containing protein [Clostridium aminobutyricum]
MIFLCFSGRERLTIATSMLYHLENHGIEIWYDNHQYTLGDKKVEKYTKAIGLSDYAIVIISKYFQESPGAIEELEVIKERYLKGLIHIFPIFYNIKASELSSEYQWLCDMIYNEINDTSGTLLACNQIICKCYKDIIYKNQYPSLEVYKTVLSGYPAATAATYINRLLELYSSVSTSNFNSKMSILFCLILYLNGSLKDDISSLYKSAQYLFNTTKLDLPYNFKEIRLLEQISEILLGLFLSKLPKEFEQ